MRTSVSRLKSDVAKLGGPQDTVELRKSVAAAISKIQDDAQNIKGQLLQVAPEHKNRQTAKILTDFEVSPMAQPPRWSSLHTIIISSSAVPDFVWWSPFQDAWSKTVIEINTAILLMCSCEPLDCVQATLKDFQTTMKVAKGKEAASLPKQPKPAASPVEEARDLESGEDPSERMALLQVH